MRSKIELIIIQVPPVPSQLGQWAESRMIGSQMHDQSAPPYHTLASQLEMTTGTGL